jgi:hypothetical protein
MSFSIIGPNTNVPPTDATAVILSNGNAEQKAGASFVVNGLTPGDTVTVTAQYRTIGAGNVIFSSRSMWAIPVG